MGLGLGAHVGLFVAGALLLGLWLREESRTPEPLIDLTVLRERAVATTNLTGLLGVASPCSRASC